MAGVTSPTMSSGIRKPKKLPKMELNVTKTRTHGAVSTLPRTTPNTMAMRMRGNRPILIFFISL